MDDRLASALTTVITGEIRAHERMGPHTTLRVGGSASVFVRAETEEDLLVIGRVCADLARPWLVLGRGSNLLVADSGWPGAVIALGPGFRGVDVIGDRVVAGAAEPMPALARACAGAGLTGMAFGVAIPGSLGGAVRMNAGAHGTELRDVLVSARVVLLDEGKRAELDVEALEMGYRQTALPADAVVVRATVQLEPADRPRIEAEMTEMRRWRRAHQPAEPSCGSVFRNPPDGSAGQLVEAAGLKGRRIGGARISPVHANFITTEPGASAADVWTLIRTAQRAVGEQFGVHLDTEVVVVGFEEAT